MIKLIVEEGSDLRTSRVSRANAETHIKANDRLANEARCLLAWERDESGHEPVAWDGDSLIFSDDIGDAEPVSVHYIVAE